MFFCQVFQAFHADLEAYAIYFRPLEIGIFARPVDRIVVATEQFSGAPHFRAAAADFAFTHVCVRRHGSGVKNQEEELPDP